MIRPEEPFEFPMSAEKSVSISVGITCFLLFFINFFFSLEITCFRAEEPFEFPISAEKFASISVKTFFSFLEITKRLTTGPFQYCPR